MRLSKYILFVCLVFLCFSSLNWPVNADSTVENVLIAAGISSFTIPQSIDGVTVQRRITIKSPNEIEVGKRYPLLFVFHGNGGNGGSFVNSAQLNTLIDAGEFIGIYPDGHLNSWNMGFEASNADDIEFVNLIMSSLAQYENADLSKVYAAGHSNGSALVNQLGKETSHFKAIAALASQQNITQGSLTPPATLSVYQVNGTVDNIIPLNGGSSVVGHEFLSADASARNWATHFNCNLTPVVTTSTWGAISTTSYSFESCTSGHVVSYHVLDGVGHGVVTDDLFYQRIWTFFQTDASGTETPASTSTPTEASVPTSTPTSTSTPVPTATLTPTSTATPIPTSTPTSTATPVPTSMPTLTSTPFLTSTPTSTATPVLTLTSTPAPTSTPVPTSTPLTMSTATPTAVSTSVSGFPSYFPSILSR